MSAIYLDGKPQHISSQLGWFKYQLREMGISQSTEQVWWAIYNDAGRDFEVACDAVELLSNDRQAFQSFAKSIQPRHTVHVVTEPMASGRIQFLIACSVLLGLSVGLFVGASL